MLVYSIVKVHISFHNFGYFVIFNPDFKHEFTCHFPRTPCIVIKLPFLYQSTGTVQQADTLGPSERVLTAAGQALGCCSPSLLPQFSFSPL